MPTYEFQHPNGQTYEIDAPSEQAALAAWESNKPPPVIGDQASYVGLSGMPDYDPEHSDLFRSAINYPKTTLGVTGGPVAAAAGYPLAPLALSVARGALPYAGAAAALYGAQKLHDMGFPEWMVEAGKDLGLAKTFKATEGRQNLEKAAERGASRALGPQPADSDEVAQAFRNDVALRYEMKPPSVPT